MNCQRTRELIDPLIDGELDLPKASEIRRHLRDCEPCHATRCDLLILSSRLKDDSLYHHAPEHLQNRIRLSLRIAVAQVN